MGKKTRADDWGSRESPEDESVEQINNAVEKMQRCEEALSTAFPGCVLTAMEMLGVVTQIIAYAGHDPEHVFANCDHCLSIVRNVRDALGWLKSETPLTHKAYVQAYEADEERRGATLH